MAEASNEGAHLQHTTATLLLRAGVDAHRVQRILRHRDVRTMTAIYGHLDVECLRDAVASLPGAAAAVPGPERPDRRASRGGRWKRPAQRRGGERSRPERVRGALPTRFYPTRIAAMPKGRASGFPLDFPALQNGRCRFRTCDPSRVKAVLYR